MDGSQLVEAPPDNSTKTVLAATIQLKREHIPDLQAKVNMVRSYLTDANAHELAANKAHYTAAWINEGFAYCIETGIAGDKPDDLRKSAALVDLLVKKRDKALKEHAFCQEVASTLQEAMTLWLAREYGVDPMSGNLQLDLEKSVLLVNGGNQEADGSQRSEPTAIAP